MNALPRIAFCCVAILGLPFAFSRSAQPQEDTKPQIVLEVLHSRATAIVSGHEIYVPQGPNGPRTIRRSRENPTPGVQLSLHDQKGPSVPEVWATAPVTINLATGEKLWFDNLGWNQVRVSFKRHAFAWRIFVEPLPKDIEIP